MNCKPYRLQVFTRATTPLVDVMVLLLLGLSATCAAWSTAVSTISYNAISTVHENNFPLFAKSTASRRMMMFVNDMSIASMILVVAALCTSLGRFASGTGELTYSDARGSSGSYSSLVDTPRTTIITRWLYIVPILNIILVPISFEHIVMCTNTVHFGGLMASTPLAPEAKDRASVNGGGGGDERTGTGGETKETSGGGGGKRGDEDERDAGNTEHDEEAARASDIVDLGRGEVESEDRWLARASEKEATHFLCDNIYRSLQPTDFARAVVRRYANVAQTEIEEKEERVAEAYKDGADDEDDVGATLVGALMKMASKNGNLAPVLGNMGKGGAFSTKIRSKRRISPLNMDRH